MPDVKKSDIEIISQVRILLLFACYSVSTVVIVVCVILLREYLMELPAKLQRVVIIGQVIASITATTQIVYNERLLRHVSQYLIPQEKFNLKKAAALLFVIMTLFYLLLYIALMLLGIRDVSFFVYLAITLGIATFATSLLVILLMDVDKVKVKAEGIADAVIKLPVKTSAVSMLLWILSGPVIGLLFYYWGGMNSLRSSAFGALLVSAGIIAFPVQYFLFKRVMEPLHDRLIERGIQPSEGRFRVPYRYKFMVGMLSTLIFVVSFLGLLNLMKANKIMHEQTNQLLNAALDRLEKTPIELQHRLEETARETGSTPFILNQGANSAEGVPEKYADLISIVATGDAKEIKRGQGENLVLWRNLPNEGIRYGLIYPSEHFSPYLAQVRNNAIVFGLLTFVFVAVVALMTSRDISRPLEAIRRKIREFGKSGGEWADDSFADDESADLAAGFRSMTKEILKQLERSRVLLENINLTVQHLSSSAGEMEAIAKEQAAGSAEQAAAIQEAQTTASEIAASARHIAESALTVDTVAGETQTSCVASADLITSAIQGMDEVRDTVNKVAHSMLDLGSRSQKIGSAVDIIQEISEQTNLLSLNASIEASGAGEEGRRFAVVAREIRRLAEGTVEASRHIKQIVAEIQRSTTGAIVQVEESTKAAEKWAGQVARIGEAFQHIESLVESATRAIREIKTNTRQQTTACEQMAEVVAEVKEVADRVVISSKETEVSMADITELTTSLRDLVASEET